MTDHPKLRFTTLALRRELPSEHHELAPVAATAIAAYGTEERTRSELELALSELPDETKPASVARLLLPPGVRLERIELELARHDLPGRLARSFPIAIHVVVVPDPSTARETDEPRGHWVFVPVLDHACYVERRENLAQRVAEDLEVLPAALALDLDGWRRLSTWAPARLEELAVELATTPLAQAKGRRALAEAERKRLAVATLEAAGRRVQPPDPAPPLVGRDAVLAELSRALDHAAKRGVLLVGDEAAGKSALVQAWAAAHPRRELWATSASELVAGASGLGEWQERVAKVLAAAEALDAILYFDDFGALFADRPAEGGIDLGAALRRHVVDGRVRVVGELTATALDRAERRDVSLIGAMLRVQVAPTDEPTSIAAGRAWAEHWKRTQPHRAQIAPETVPTAVDLARRYLPYRAFPGKVVRLLEELRVAHDGARDEHGKGPVLGDSALYAAFSWASGIPVALLDDARPVAIADVIGELRRRMIGQDEAVRRVAEALCVAKARLQPADKPLASLLFVGPSGVGKTELARAVAAYLFGAPDRMVRLDMSEYTDPWAAERLFGGDGDEGRLTAAVRSQPFGVVLLDEIEKAHPSVFDLLLQVLGEARLTDGRGRTTYFHNAIIVLTSNLGTRGAKGRLGLAPARDARDVEARRYRDAVLAAFRPELVNRLDQIVVFHALEEHEIAKVAEIAIGRLADRRGFAQSSVQLDISPAAIARLAEAGFSPELGARALRRHLDAALLAPAARLLARAGAEGRGATLTVRAGADDAPIVKPDGSRLGEHTGDVAIALWRRSAATGKRLVRGALSLGELRRATDRELALSAVQAVRDRLGEIEGTLATAARKTGGKTALPGAELARLSAEHARLGALIGACVSAQGELRAAEELCLEALARDIDAVDMVDTAVAQRAQFRSHLFWLVTALRPPGHGATLLVHAAEPGGAPGSAGSVTRGDARAAVVAWVKLALGAAAHHGWRAHVHTWTDRGWGEPREPDDLAKDPPQAALVRVAGSGADLLYVLEAGLQRFLGLAGEACHVWVEALEPRATFSELEWANLPQPPQPKAPRGLVFREVNVSDDSVQVYGDELDVPWRELARRLPEAAVDRVLETIDHQGHGCRFDHGASLWNWTKPLGGAQP
ncbi:MAG TPA: AAA family ATPase [Kofleriaceae bacterium]|nr:AAA family ATPase [Kofleriaceae bacterium]